MNMGEDKLTDEMRLTEEDRLDRIARTLDAQRHRLDFVRSNLFFGAGCIALITLTAQFALDRLTGSGWLWYLLWLPAAITGCGLLRVWRDRHRTITLTDRTMLNVWLFAFGVSGCTAVYLDGQLPVAGFMSIGMTIATAFTSELFRRNDPNKSNQSGSLVILQLAAGSGAFLSAWIFRAALDGEILMQFLLSFATVALLLFGTGAVLRYNENRNRV